MLHNFIFACHFSSLSKNKIGDVGFSTVMDALITTHGALKKIGYVSYIQLKFCIIIKTITIKVIILHIVVHFVVV